MNAQETLAAVVAQVDEFRDRFRSDRLVDRDDAAQQAVLGLLKRGTVPPVGRAGVKAYAFRVGLLSMAHARRTAGRYAKALTRHEAETGHTPPWQDGPLAALLSAELRERVAGAIDRLPSDERDEVLAHFFAAERTAVDPARRTERARVRCRALRRLALLLADLSPGSVRSDSASTAAAHRPRRGAGSDHGTVAKSSRRGPAAA